ncbi:MAG: hypothetical protein AAGC57_01535 [Pseudomonadota bacterium]
MSEPPADPRTTGDPEIARKWLLAFQKAHPDIVAATPPKGQIRGIDAYARPELLHQVVAQALEIHRRRHGRWPMPHRLERTADCFFADKFFGAYPIDPNPADKLNAAVWLPEPLSGLVRVAERPWVADAPGLPPDDSVPPGRWILKLGLGNATNEWIDWPPSAKERARLDALTSEWFQGRYGVRWGEWWYAIGKQRLFLEQDLTEARAGRPEFKLFTRGGRVVMIRAILHRKAQGLPNGERFYDAAFRPIKGQSVGYAPMASPPPASAERMLEAAAGIGRHFNRMRVDFLDTGDERPWLNELTIGDVNARRIMTPDLDCSFRRLMFE